ncbi:MAG: hypothetical protein ACD_40C00320G0010 [uncultured bacterium]|uniref:Uncharacterized protein n=1 Tax=Candidatus Woesebacteria bacterium GW2011_GWA2_44_33 TaxID=1618564 RepID=A0A0G1J095_9BACT|nr:MAG: hypothetical protein ACD_40C00320G0010 [uncultured bacterium]KKT64748.1 MAG: hypothetical protein UW60_C0052G0002 [Candidatus Woesebacteria bacterium GW2011_GWA2_44_33]
MLQKKHIELQFNRLKRHLGLAKQKDSISFLDLAHSLRIWVELKDKIDKLAEQENYSFNLPNGPNNSGIKKILKNSKFLYVPLGSVDESTSPNLQVKGLSIINRVLSAEEIKKTFEMGPPRITIVPLTFTQWLGAEIISTSDKNGTYIGISREILIKRVSNILGASHPEGLDKGNKNENKYDPYVRELYSYMVADGYPLTHYQLIEIGETIIKSLGNLILGINRDSTPGVLAL